MANASYTRGRSFEYERVHFHRSNGAFLAVRIAGSRGPWDVLALYAHRVVLEQCKRVPEITPEMEFRAERQYLAGFRVPFGVEASLVVRGERGMTRSFRVHPAVPTTSDATRPVEGAALSPVTPAAPPTPTSKAVAQAPVHTMPAPRP